MILYDMSEMDACKILEMAGIGNGRPVSNPS